MRSMLSIVTITFNNYEELTSTINSTLACINVENVVINGGSCEKTKKYLDNTPLNSITESDNGISDAFNKGVKYAKGDFITFLNSGDHLLDENYYAEAQKIFQNNPDVDYIFADILFDHKDFGQITVKPNPERYKIPYPHPSLIVRKSVFEQIGLFDEEYKVAMDFDFMCRMKEKKLKGYYYSKTPVVLMDGTGVSSSNGNAGIQERVRALKSSGLMDFSSNLYFSKLKAKMKARDILESLGLLKKYDALKSNISKKRAE